MVREDALFVLVLTPREYAALKMPMKAAFTTLPESDDTVP